MTTAFLYDQQIEECPEFWTDEMINEYLEFQDNQDNEYFDCDDDQALEEYSLACAYGEEY